MRIYFWLFFFFGNLCVLNAQLKSVNHTDRIDVIQWNMEWFGDTSFGPSNEKLQFSNALSVIKKLDADIFTLCEVSDSLTWLKLKDSVVGYQGEISTWAQKQKMAILFKTSKFKLIYKKHILGAYSTDFASGRIPLELCFQTTLNGKLDSIYVIVIHLKSNVGTTAQKDDSYNRRKNSSNELITYLDANFSNKKVIVAGDWNDDFDVSIWQNYTTPFLNINQNTNYTQVTQRLTLNSIGTTTSYPDPIDHFVINNSLKKYWVKDSVFVINPTADIKGYGSNTSDHFPVYCGFFNNLNQSNISQIKKEFKFYFNGNQWIGTGIDLEKQIISVFDYSGRLIYEGLISGFSPKTNTVHFIYFNEFHFTQPYIYTD